MLAVLEYAMGALPVDDFPKLVFCCIEYHCLCLSEGGPLTCVSPPIESMTTAGLSVCPSVCMSGWLAPFVTSLSVTHLSLRIGRVCVCAEESNRSLSVVTQFISVAPCVQFFS
jgi:hypothetical protein